LSYTIEFTTAAARQIRKLPRNVRTRVLDAVETLSVEPRPQGARKLVGEDIAWRLRTGDYRIIYEIVDDTLTVTIVRAAHRREVYKR
jgi:mRNA interferase RelE/StbE